MDQNVSVSKVSLVHLVRSTIVHWDFAHFLLMPRELSSAIAHKSLILTVHMESVIALAHQVNLALIASMRILNVLLEVVMATLMHNAIMVRVSAKRDIPPQLFR